MFDSVDNFIYLFAVQTTTRLSTNIFLVFNGVMSEVAALVFNGVMSEVAARFLFLFSLFLNCWNCWLSLFKLSFHNIISNCTIP
jgi:hypothetical protein